VRKTKMAISFSRFRKSFSTLWGGAVARLSTLTSSETDSSSEKLFKQMSNKVIMLAEENRRLKEELRLRDLYDNREHDI
jgi:1,2-phenylacetyl-CoA epoxidase PaaB subunit